MYSAEAGLEPFIHRMLSAKERRRFPFPARETNLRPGVLFESHFSGYSGYSKAARQIAMRISSSIYVEAVDLAGGAGWESSTEHLKLSGLRRIRVGPDTPYLRFYGPDVKERPGWRASICWTMMESGSVHRDMIDAMNRFFDEIWTPSAWNARTFTNSGLERPVRVMPLGVDPLVYRPEKPKPCLPPCRLISTRRAGIMEIPKADFLFLSVGLPSFRKGFDVLVKAFRSAFRGDDDVVLILATTFFHMDSIFRGTKNRIYALEGTFDEHSMARIYNACDAYVCASRGEGWNLPACEAAACGLPIILPRNSCHEEVFLDGALYFDAEGCAPVPGAESISPWYAGVPFSVFGRKSIRQLSSLLQEVRRRTPDSIRTASRGREIMITERTWNRAAEAVCRRLLELNP